MLKDRKDYDQEDDVDLTGMINEYSQDNELRRKIEELKKQKEEEKRRTQPTSVLDQLAEMSEKDSYRPSAFDTPTPAKSSGIPDIRVDDEFEKTRVGFDNDSAYDKTLVIMDRKTSASGYQDEEEEDESKTNVFDLHQVPPFHTSSNDEEDEDEEEDDDDDDNLLSRIKERKKEKALAKKQREQEEDDEEEEDEDHDNGKMNKVITYVIIGIVGICIIVGAFFGVKYALKNFLGGSDSKPADKTTETNKNKTPETNDSNKTNTTDDSKKTDTSNKTDISDKEAVIARLNKQLSTYEDQLKGIEKEIASVTKEKEAADKTISSLKSILDEASTYQSHASEIQKLQTALQTAQGNYDAETDEAKKAVLKTTLDAAQSAYDTAVSTYGSYDDLVAKSNEKNTEYNTKSAEATTAQAAAQTKLDDLNARKETVQTNIANTTTELGKYE